MKNKKGEETWGWEIAKILIAIVCIVFLVILSVKLYGITVGSKQNTQANEILKQVGDKINYLSKEDTMILAGPKGWFLETRDNNRLCVLCYKDLGGACPKNYNANAPTCVSIKTGLAFELSGGKIEVYITELMLKKTAEGENERIVISEKK